MMQKKKGSKRKYNGRFYDYLEKIKEVLIVKIKKESVKRRQEKEQFFDALQKVNGYVRKITNAKSDEMFFSFMAEGTASMAVQNDEGLFVDNSRYEEETVNEKNSKKPILYSLRKIFFREKPKGLSTEFGRFYIDIASATVEVRLWPHLDEIFDSLLDCLNQVYPHDINTNDRKPKFKL